MGLKEDALKLHIGGKLEVNPICKLEDKNDLKLCYTPGVAEPCKVIHDDPKMVYEYTSKANTVAVITDGTAVLGLGDIGPEAALPVMEGKCALFKRFAGLNSVPICLDTKDPDEIIKIVKALAPTYGGINLEDISAPRCVYIERKLVEELDIPLMHDDQHGTSIVVGAAILNCCRLTKKKISDLKVVMSGTGAAGSNIARMLKKLGVKTIYAYNITGVIDKSRYDEYDFLIKELIDDGIYDTPEVHDNTLKSIIKGSNVFIGVSAPNLVTKDMVKSMVDPFVFALANPNPEITYTDCKEAGALICGTGRSDYPNQINNLLAFPGVFKGALMAKAKKITPNMKMAAAYALSEIITDSELSYDYILPDAFDTRVVKRVSEGVMEQAIKDKITRE